MAEIVIELLTKDHDRKSFKCKKPEYTDFLQQRARKHAEQNLSKTWVAVEQGGRAILAYITLSMGNVSLEEVGEEIKNKLPRHPIPVLHVGRLATDEQHVGRGLGSVLLQFAAGKAIEASTTIGCFALELTADGEDAFNYYLRRGFLPLKRDTTRLYLPIETLKAAEAATEARQSS